MAMCHPVLLLEEIIRQVFSWLPKSGLAAAVRTCVAWKEPALDALWNEIDLQNLLRIVYPIGMISAKGDPSAHGWGAKIFSYGVADRSWPSFNNLAPKVLTAALESPLAWPLLSGLSSKQGTLLPKPLLPNVRTLSVVVDDNPSTISIFLSNTVTDLKIIGSRLASYESREDSGEAMIGFFSTLGSVCPNLRVLYLDLYWLGTPVADDEAAALVSTLQGLHGLRRFTLKMDYMLGINPIFQELAVLPSLESLTLAGEECDELAWSGSHLHAFSALHHLYLSWCPIADLPSLLNDLSPCLEELELGAANGCHVEADLRELLRSVARFKDLMSFATAVRDIGPGIDTAGFRSLSPCASLSRLRIFSNSSALDIIEDELGAILACWPRLTELEITMTALPPKFTLGVLTVVVATCPFIQRVSLPVDATRPVEPTTVVVRPSESLRSIDVQDAPIQDIQVVARYLSQLIAHPHCEIIHKIKLAQLTVGWLWMDAARLTAEIVRTRNAHAAGATAGFD